MATIVVIDSEETVRAVITKILRTGGHSVRACEALGEAIQAANTGKPDLILTNVYLRDSTGRDAMETFKRALPDVPVLMVSGLPDEDVIQDWCETRGFDIFPKPFTAGSLLSKVSEMLTQNPSMHS